MSLSKRITAVILTFVLVVGAIPAISASANENNYEKEFDVKTGGSVTYYALGNTETLNDTLISDQWALNNDGTFTLKSGSNDFDVYDNPFGSHFGPGQWSYPSDWSNWDNSSGWDNWNSWGYYWGFASRGNSYSQSTAVSGVDINIQEAWKKYNSNESNKDVIVAVIDTGVDYTHEDLSDSIWVNEDEIPDNGIDDDKNGYIDDVYGWNFYDNSNIVYTGRNDDHGTHCAGTIAAQSDNSKGIASVTGGTHVKVMVLKALGGSEGTGETLSVVQAIKYAEENGASIVNLSLGSSYSDELLYNTIASSSMLFVVASGNGSNYTGRGYDTDRTPCYPASYDLDNIISVANISYDGTLHSSSNYGAKSVDIAAPGTYIISTTPGNDYGYMTGTSMSAPFVTAAAAYVYSYYNGITLKDVKDILLGSAKKLDSLTDKTVSGGMLDVGAALSYNTSKLSHKKFDTKKNSGTAPVLSYTAYRQNNRIYITLEMSDKENDLYALFYANGEHTAEEFAFGSKGTEYTLKSSSNASFVSTQYGTYTFYAIDSEGNESVLVITLTEDNVEEKTGSSPQTSQKPSRRRSGWSWRG